MFFQENALTGLLFVIGIALCSPIMAAGLLVGAVIGTAVAHFMKFDQGEVTAGIYGFNAALVGIATLFFFQLGMVSIALLLVGCVAVTFLTRAMRQFVPFPTYTMPFVLTTWVIFFAGNAAGAPPFDLTTKALVPNFAMPFHVEATAHGIGQVMFQGSFWTGLFFLVGIAINDKRHATWVLLGSIVGMLVASYHIEVGSRAIDPERLINRSQYETILLGLYGYNATLAAVALSLWRKSIIPPILGILLSVPLTEFVPMLGLPALTAPFVLATWLVILLGQLETMLLADSKSKA